MKPTFFAPINTGFTDGGGPDRRLFDFHLARSGPDIGINYVGNVAIAPKYRTNPQTAVIDCNVKRWSRLAKGILDCGSAPGVQLGCRVDEIPSARKWFNKDTENFTAQMREHISSLSHSDLSCILERFYSSCCRAADSGFRVIQIHAAHGYFLSALMSDVVNIRTDKFNPFDLYFHLYLIEKIKSNRPEAILDIRVSLNDGFFDGQDQNVRDKQIETIANSKVDMISLTSGMYNSNRFLIYPTPKAGHAVYFPDACQWAKKHPGKMWGVAGNIWDLNRIWPQRPANLYIGAGRKLLANPRFFEDFFQIRR